MDTLGRAALVSSLFGFAVFATFVETGVLRKTFRGAEPAQALGELSEKKLLQAGVAGALSGVLSFTALA
jgi:hypothetical protein